MSISPLQIDDKEFLVASTIDRCPRTMMIRELVRNALEAAEQAPGGSGRVEFRIADYDGTRKLAIWNSGPGMDAGELRRMCDLASSIGKEKGLDANFGMGAKVASLPSNKRGMIYRSCKSGSVSEVILCFLDGVYGRMNRQIDGELSDVLDITENCKADGRDLAEDWTEVTLLGNRDDQDTVRDPYDGDPESDGQWLATYLYHRFYRIADDVKVVFNPGTHKLDGTRTFKPITARLDEVFERWETVEAESGIKIHYVYDAAYDKMPSHNRSISGALQSALSNVAVVYKDEMYDVKTGRAWTFSAPIFGIPFGARHISVHIELPNDAQVRPEGYRQFLRYNTGEQAQIQASDFADLVARNRPQWLIDLIRSFAPETRSSDDVREELQKLLDDLRVTRIAPRSNDTGVHAISSEPGVGSEPIRVGLGGGVVGPPKTRHTDLSLAPAGAKKADLLKDRERAPEIILLYETDEIDQKQIRARAARYFEHGQLFLNMQYPAIEAMSGALQQQYSSVADLEGMRIEAVRLAEDAMVRRVGRAVVHALAKQLNKEWDQEAVLQALKPESLSLAADVYVDSLQSARRSIGRLFGASRDEATTDPSEAAVPVSSEVEFQEA